MTDTSNLLKQLQGACGRRTKIRVIRPFSGERLTNGFLVGMGRSLIVMQQFHDFYCEGFAALRIADIIDFRSGKYERFWEEMLSSERLMENVGIPYPVNCDSMVDLIRGLRSRAANIIVEHEYENSEDDDEFCLGKVVELTPESVSLLCLNANGVWDKDPTAIPITKITKVQFDTPYINIFSRYAREPESP